VHQRVALVDVRRDVVRDLPGGVTETDARSKVVAPIQTG